MRHWSFLIAYFSPETMLPLSSIIATVAGFSLLIKRSSLRFAALCLRAAMRNRRRVVRANRPHFRVPDDAFSRTAGPGSGGKRGIGMR